MTFVLNFPTANAIYDDLIFTVDGAPVAITNEKNAALGSVKIPAGHVARLAINYRSQGLNEWRYNFGSTDVTQVKNFALKMKQLQDTISLTTRSRPPEKHIRRRVGNHLSYKIYSGHQIAMGAEKLQPGLGRQNIFCPSALLFFPHEIITTGVTSISFDELLFPAAAFSSSTCCSLTLRLRSNTRVSLGGVGFSGRQLSPPCCWPSLREQRSSPGAVCLSGDVFVRVFPQGRHRPGNHARFCCYPLRRNANYRTNTLGR